MAKFKRLNRFLQRIGMKKKKQQSQNESVDLAPSRSSRSWSSRLLNILKIKSRRSGHDGNHDDHDDASAADSISVSPQYSGVNEEAVNNVPVHELDQVSTIDLEELESFHCASRADSIMSVCSCSDITSVTKLSDYELHGEISHVSSELSLIMTDTDDQDTSFTILMTSIEEFMDVKSNGSEGTESEQTAEPVCTAQSEDDHKELFDEDEEHQSNSIDDHIILFLPVIVTLVLTLCIYLLYLICD